MGHWKFDIVSKEMTKASPRHTRTLGPNACATAYVGNPLTRAATDEDVMEKSSHD